MHFTVEHYFAGVGVDEFEKLYFDEPFNVALCQYVDMQRTLISWNEANGGVVREVDVVPKRAVPAPLRALLGGNAVGYRERVDYRWAAHEGQFTCVPTVLADRVSVAGSLSVRPKDDGVVRVVTGDVRVSVFGLGGAVERFIVADTKRSYDDAAKFTREQLAAR